MPSTVSIITTPPATLLLPAAPGSGMEAVVCGFNLPYLPDFLNDHTLLGQTPAEKLQEVLERFTRFLSGLRKYHGSAFALRFYALPQTGSIQVNFLTRIQAAPKQAETAARQLAQDVQTHLTSYGFNAVPLQADGLRQALNPFGQPAAFVELRQQEAVIPLPTVGKEAFVVYPYWGPTGACLEPFETLLRLPVPAVLSIHIQPTELTPQEMDSLSEASYIAQTLANNERAAVSETTIRRTHDPNAELVGRIYAAYLKSLSDPFLVTVQIASSDPNAAWTAGRAYASALGQRLSSRIPAQDEQELPAGADILTPQNQDEYTKALTSFQQLTWLPWGTSRATPGKERLPYLAGAKGAATAFRFPVSVRGGVPGIAVRQSPPDFEPGPRPEKAGPAEIHLGNYERGGAAVVHLNDLVRHTLITGFTGSGKTNTVLYLLDQLWKEKHIPFLVIEAAKKEYRALANVPGFNDLLVFSLGDETCSPFRLNPFELMPGVRLEAHLGRLQACFDAALPQFGILPSIIAESLENIYKTLGWKLTDKATGQEERLFPTLRDLFDEVIRVAESRGYAGETYHNIRAAAAGRIGNLLRGSRGRMFGCQRSYPAEQLFSRPVVLELNDLNEDDKALTMMFLLTWLREYRELHQGNTLQHVTVVEEAHNVLSNVTPSGNTEVSADTKAKAVGAFTNLLSEVRSYGEGLVISDQSPEKLAPDALRNTNLQLAHQLRDQHDRQAVARAMIMDETQQEFLGKLRTGQAAYFRTGLEKAAFITVPPYKDQAGFASLPSDETIKTRMASFQQQHLTETLPFDGCRFCGSPCRFREDLEPYTLDKELNETLVRGMQRFNDHPEPEARPENWREVAKPAVEAAKLAGHPKQVDAAYCFLAHELKLRFRQSMRERFETAFHEIAGSKG